MYKRFLRAAVLILIVTLIAFVGINLLILRSTQALIVHIDDATPMQAALILGTSVRSNGTPARLLQDRLRVGAQLFDAKKVEKIIVSGDHGTKEYNEVEVMRDYLVNAGVPSEDIFMDHAGFDTYDSEYRARVIFQAQSITIVSQSFHLPRALYIAKGLGIPAIGVSADLRTYTDAIVWRNAVREPLSRIKAFFDVWFNVRPTYLGKPIPLSNDGRTTQ